mgnify:CR=1 FL=1
MKLFKFNLFIILLFFFSCNSKINHKISINRNNFFTHTKEIINIKKNNKAKILFALDPECPLCKSYSKTINELYYKYKDSIEFYTFFPSPIYSKIKTENFIEQYKLNMHLIIDTNQILTNFLDAKVTPECFLLNKDLNIIYQGLIDDWIKEIGRKRKYINNNYLDDAINAYLNNDSISNTKTTAIGCIIEKLK